ncbi:MAG: SDR family NAD(P)-dependent oxidoreductase [Pseudomonadota bacterium]
MTEKAALTGQVAVVTGGARGIGAATATLLARRGAHVFLSDVLDAEPVAAAIRDSGGSATAATLDVTDRDACNAHIQSIHEAAGSVDILVCNAGVCPPGQPVGSQSQWDSVMRVNLEGSQHCIAPAWPIMEAQQRGSIVLVSSAAFYQGGLIVGTEYAASKAALIGMTRHLARNGGPVGIRVNAVAPGIIDTDMTAGFDKPDLQKIPLRRYGTADEVAGPIIFLCEPAAGYMTGTVLNITGGMVLAA